MKKRSLYVLVPGNLIFVGVVYIFARLGIPGMAVDAANHLFIAYVAAFGILYGILTAVAYSQTPNRVMLLGNVFNLAASLLINHFILADVWKDFPGEYFFIFFSTQNLIFIWFALLVWQCIIRLCVWVKNVI